eukprot:5153427-Pleurochrysis_carterae.AAC.2
MWTPPPTQASFICRNGSTLSRSSRRISPMASPRPSTYRKRPPPRICRRTWRPPFSRKPTAL